MQNMITSSILIFSFLLISSCSRVQESINFSKNVTEQKLNMPGYRTHYFSYDVDRKPWNKVWESILGTCSVLWRKLWETFSYAFQYCDKPVFCFLPNTVCSYLYFSILHLLTTVIMLLYLLSPWTLLFLTANSVPNQICVLKRGRGRSPNTSASPWTLLARALMDAAMSIGSWGSWIKEQTRNKSVS
jgi:hypothetical protein